MNNAYWSLLSVCRNRLAPKADWRRLFGGDFDAVEGFLTETPNGDDLWYPCPDSGIPLTVRQRKDGFYAFAPPELGLEIERIDGLSASDIQRWKIDWDLVAARLAAVLGLRPAVAGEFQAGGGLRLVGTTGSGDAVRCVYLVANDADGDILCACDAACQKGFPSTVLLMRFHATGANLLKRMGSRACVLGDVVDLRMLSGGWGFEAIDAAAVTAAGHGAAAGQEDMTVRDAVAHIDKRIDRVGRDFEVLQRENVELKRGLVEVLSGLARKVEPEYFQWIFVILGTGSVRAAARMLGVSVSTFDQRLKQYVARGGLYGVLYSMVRARNRLGGRKQMVHFNEVFAAHQSPDAVAEADALTELLNGLEDMHQGNWLGMRDELIEIAREGVAGR